MPGYAYVWEFRTSPATRDAFLEAYGPGGAWDALFRRDPAFLGTLLLQSQADPDTFLTVDRWESEAALRSFLDSHRAEYEAIDRQCESLTLSEREIGKFDLAK